MDAIPVTKPTVLEHDIPGTPKLTWFLPTLFTHWQLLVTLSILLHQYSTCHPMKSASSMPKLLAECLKCMTRAVWVNWVGKELAPGDVPLALGHDWLNPAEHHVSTGWQCQRCWWDLCRIEVHDTCNNCLHDVHYNPRTCTCYAQFECYDDNNDNACFNSHFSGQHGYAGTRMSSIFDFIGGKDDGGCGVNWSYNAC